MSSPQTRQSVLSVKSAQPMRVRLSSTAPESLSSPRTPSTLGFSEMPRSERERQLQMEIASYSFTNAENHLEKAKYGAASVMDKNRNSAEVN